MTPNGIKVDIDDLATMEIKALSKREVADIIANKVVEKYGDALVEQITSCISIRDIRSIVLDKMADSIIEEWRNRD